MSDAAVTHYFDYKSPYAYLAQEDTWRLQSELGVKVDWLPFTLNIPDFMGEAKLDESGRDTVGTRTEHQWRRVKYLYMDCRREANRRGLVVRGPKKIWDSSIAHIGFLYAKARGDFRGYHDRVFERFWKRELDIESVDVIASVLDEGGCDPSGFEAFLAGPGRQEHDRARARAEELGVFGVPSYVVGDQLFWGGERLERVRELVAPGSGVS